MLISQRLPLRQKSKSTDFPQVIFCKEGTSHRIPHGRSAIIILRQQMLSCFKMTQLALEITLLTEKDDVSVDRIYYTATLSCDNSALHQCELCETEFPNLTKLINLFENFILLLYFQLFILKLTILNYNLMNKIKVERIVYRH